MRIRFGKDFGSEHWRTAIGVTRIWDFAVTGILLVIISRKGQYDRKKE